MDFLKLKNSDPTVLPCPPKSAVAEKTSPCFHFSGTFFPGQNENGDISTLCSREEIHKRVTLPELSDVFRKKSCCNLYEAMYILLHQMERLNVIADSGEHFTYL